MAEKVFPGDEVSSCEEFASGANTFEDEGTVFSSVVGAVAFDKAGRQAHVNSVKGVEPLAKGHLVYARVEDLYEQVALVSFSPVKKFVASHNNFGYLRISEIRREYVESFRNNIGIGDVLRGRVVEITPLGVYLTVSSPDLGVVRAFCRNCRSRLRFEKGSLVCGECGGKEFRKMALKRR